MHIFFPSQQTIQIPFLITNYSSDAMLVLPSGKFKVEAWATCQVEIKEVKNLLHCRIHACFRERTMIQADQTVVKHNHVGVICGFFYKILSRSEVLRHCNGFCSFTSKMAAVVSFFYFSYCRF